MYLVSTYLTIQTLFLNFKLKCLEIKIGYG